MPDVSLNFSKFVKKNISDYVFTVVKLVPSNSEEGIPIFRKLFNLK
jgi:hypothetical protein